MPSNKTKLQLIVEYTYRGNHVKKCLRGGAEMCAYYVEYDFFNPWHRDISGMAIPTKNRGNNICRHLHHLQLLSNPLLRHHLTFTRKMRKIDILYIWPWIDFFAHVGSVGTIDISFIMVYLRPPPIFSSMRIFANRNAYFDWVKMRGVWKKTINKYCGEVSNPGNNVKFHG